MDKKDEDRELGPPVMEGAEEPSHIELGGDFHNALVCLLEIGHIVKSKGHSGDKLDDKQKKDDPTRIVPDFMFVDRDGLLLGKLPQRLKVIAI